MLPRRCQSRKTSYCCPVTQKVQWSLIHVTDIKFPFFLGKLHFFTWHSFLPVALLSSNELRLIFYRWLKYFTNLFFPVSFFIKAVFQWCLLRADLQNNNKEELKQWLLKFLSSRFWTWNSAIKGPNNLNNLLIRISCPK